MAKFLATGYQEKELLLLNDDGPADVSVVEGTNSPRRRRASAYVLPALALGAIAATAAYVGGPKRSVSAAVDQSAIQGLDEQACHTAVPGEECYGKVTWARSTGIKQHKDWYPGLTAASPPEDFQQHFFEKNYGHCPKPCPAAPITGPAHCLCLFDVDRTLTANQAMAGKCPGTQQHKGVQDTAFAGGDLVLSDLSVKMQTTFCSECMVGIVSAGCAGGPPEKNVLQTVLPSAGTEWHYGPADIAAPLVVNCPDNQKAQCAEDIVNWIRAVKRVNLPSDEVYFFDDHTGNTNGFGERGFNARQVSCQSREGIIGGCGALASEVVREKGVKNC